MSELHVVFGAGAIGRALAGGLLDRGHRVRVISRSGRGWAGGVGVEAVAADASSVEQASRAAAGADVVYQVLNPPYAKWAELFPGLQRGALAAAEAAGARYVSMDNLYMYGPTGGRPLTEESPVAPTTKKGRLRATMAEEVLEAHRSGRLETTIGRASDYFGPGGGAQSNLGDRVLRPALAGRTASVLGDPDQPHTYSYIPDIAAGLALLGEHPDAPGRAWHLPNDPHTRTTRQLVDVVYRAAGHPARLRPTPDWLIRTIGLVNPTLAAVAEMTYLFDAPFVVDSSRIAELGATATPVEEALAATVEAERAA